MEQLSTDPADLIIENFNLRRCLRLLVFQADKIQAAIPSAALQDRETAQATKDFCATISQARSLLAGEQAKREEKIAESMLQEKAQQRSLF